MEVKWLNVKEKVGTASFYDTGINLNTVASVPFDYAYRVQVGIDENKNVIIQPLDKERVIRGDLDEYSLIKIVVKKTYSRISSTGMMKQISSALNIELSKEPIKFSTKWDNLSNVLIIQTGGKD